jgi:hypothetical protein
MGINLTATGAVWDIYVSAEIDLNGSLPEVVDISIRDPDDNHLWNASDDGILTNDGALYLNPTPGLPPDNLSVEARFPLAILGITSGVIFSQFRSHSSRQVDSAVKDYVPNFAGNYTIIIIDNLPPNLGILLDTPDPQENGGNVNISVDVTDDFSVDTVWVNITYPGSSWSNFSMQKGPGDTWYFTIPYNNLGDYSYMIYANDSADNWNSTGPGTFEIIDTDGPFLDNVLDFPDPQENGGSVTISVDARDDISLGWVWINITYPDNSTWLNTSMNQGIGDEWNYIANYDDLGTYSYIIWANDTNNNWDLLGPNTFTIHDTDGPFFNTLLDIPDPQENGGTVNISVDVTDDFAVGGVYVLLTYPGSAPVNITMDKGPGDNWFLNTTLDNIGVYSYEIYANDINNNWNATSSKTITIQDTDGPEIDNLTHTPDPAENGDNVNVTVDVVDDVDVGEVWINITFPNGTWTNTTMKPGDNTEWFIDKTFDDPGDYTYTIWARDTSYNWVDGGSGTIRIRDTDGPEFSDLVDSPDPQDKGKHVNISVDVTDDIAVDEVWIIITFPNGTWINATMKKGPDNQYYYNGTFDFDGNYTYIVWARDESGNTNTTDPGNFIISPEPPEEGLTLFEMITLFFFWPLLLIIFTVALVQRYGSNNRFRKEIKPALISQRDHYLAHPEEIPLAFDKFLDIAALATGIGIPSEELIMAAFETEGYPIFEMEVIGK